jgi:hypothetical protein
MLTLLVPALSALGGNWLGTRSAFDRLRNETAFRRRTEWFERLIGVMSDYDDHLRDYWAGYVANDFERCDEIRPKFIESIAALQRTRRQERLYASEKVLRILREYDDETRKIIPVLTKDADERLVGAAVQHFLKTSDAAQGDIAAQYRKAAGLTD